MSKLQKVDDREILDRGILHIFRTTWGISMKFSGEMWLKIMLKISKNQGFTLSLEDTFFKKPQEWGRGGGQIDTPSRFRVKSDSQLSNKSLYLLQWKPFKSDENAFYFISKALFVLKIFKFLSWIFGHVEKKVWLER